MLNDSKLLTQEINWWRNSLSSQPIDDGVYRKLTSPKDSFLCCQYNNENQLERACKSCPVYKYTELQYCEGTPYADIVREHDDLLAQQDKISETENKILKEIFLRELTIVELKLYQTCCDYWRFLKYQVLPFTINQEKNELH